MNDLFSGWVVNTIGIYILLPFLIVYPENLIKNVSVFDKQKEKILNHEHNVNILTLHS